MTEGIEIANLAGSQVRVFSVAKTVADCFKFGNKISLDVALEALREAWNGKRDDGRTVALRGDLQGSKRHASVSGSGGDGMKATNRAASVRARLLNRARADKVDFDLILTRYSLERLLYRLSVSPWADQFLLKGALFLTCGSTSPTGRRGILICLASDLQRLKT